MDCNQINNESVMNYPHDDYVWDVVKDLIISTFLFQSQTSFGCLLRFNPIRKRIFTQNLQEKNV